MPKCCEECFKDSYIRSFISSGNVKGKCSYCDSNQVYISNVEIVGDFIKKSLLKKYQTLDTLWERSGGSSPDPRYWHLEHILATTAKAIISEEEKIFLKSNYEFLLDDFFKYTEEIENEDEDFWENGDVKLIPKDQMSDEEYPYTSPVLSWEEFKFVTKHNNRFFNLDENNREELLKDISEIFAKLTIKLPSNSQICRARIMPDYDFSRDTKSIIKECGPPPVESSKPLRMNPVGISYFYGSTDEKTCLVEIRAGFNDRYILGKFKTRKELKLLDLTTNWYELKEPSIFSEDYKEDLHQSIRFISDFANEVSKPVSDSEAPLEYLPTQVLSEYLRKEGFEGICFRSSLTNEKNYTLFCGPKEEHYPLYPFTYSNYGLIPSEYTEWLYLVEYQEGVINDIDYENTIIDFNETR